jgi:hypothetical protein
MQKRGSIGDNQRAQVQVDWVMSLAIFMLYLAFFFIYIRPMLAPPQSMDALLSVAKEGLEKNITWSIQVVPFFVSSNVSAVDEPIVVKLPYNWQRNSFALANKQYIFFDESKIFFLANSSAKSVYWLSHTDEVNYSLTAPVKDLSATPSSASVSKKDFRADFENSLLSKIEYRGSYRLTNFNLSLGEETITPADITNKSSTVTNIVAQYKILAQTMNHSSYVFAENSRIYNYAYLYGPARNLTISATLGNYTKYYSDEAHSGNIKNISCSSFFNNYIDLYGSAAGLTFITDQQANVTICNANTSIELKITLSLKNDTPYQIILHPGDYRQTRQYINYYKTDFGVVENLTGLSEQRINRTNQTGYAALKKQWGYPETREFSFYVVNASQAAMYAYEQETPASTANVYVTKWQDYVIDEYSNKKLYEVRIKVW